MDKKINLEEIIQKCVGIRPGAKNTTPMDYGECKFVLRYFAEKLLALAAENADIEYSHCERNEQIYIINKQSITDIIKLVE